jgi:hypothetical protein
VIEAVSMAVIVVVASTSWHGFVTGQVVVVKVTTSVVVLVDSGASVVVVGVSEVSEVSELVGATLSVVDDSGALEVELCCSSSQLNVNLEYVAHGWQSSLMQLSPAPQPVSPPTAAWLAMEYSVLQWSPGKSERGMVQTALSWSSEILQAPFSDV